MSNGWTSAAYLTCSCGAALACPLRVANSVDSSTSPRCSQALPPARPLSRTPGLPHRGSRTKTVRMQGFDYSYWISFSSYQSQQKQVSVCPCPTVSGSSHGVSGLEASHLKGTFGVLTQGAQVCSASSIRATELLACTAPVPSHWEHNEEHRPLYLTKRHVRRPRW